MKCFLIFLLCLIYLKTDAQDLKKQAVKFTFQNEKSTDFSIETFKFYVSQLVFLKNGEIVFEEKNSFHLIDIINNKNQFSFDINESIEYDQIQFLLGIDSLTNVSGALDGDLDPTKGMYWAWQSGYINFKLEGIHSKCPTRDNKFQFHLGGYLPPFLAAKSVLLNCKPSDNIQITFDTASFLNQIDFTNTNTIMSPGQKTVDLSATCVKHFKVIE